MAAETINGGRALSVEQVQAGVGGEILARGRQGRYKERAGRRRNQGNMRK